MISQETAKILKDKYLSGKSFDFNQKNIIALVNTYIFASVLYYEFDISIITDFEFDMLCKKLLERYDEIMLDQKVKNAHKKLLEKDILEAGSGYHLRLAVLESSTADYVSFLKFLATEK